MRLIVTRPASDGQRTAQALAARGHVAILAPVLEIHLRQGAALDLDEATALVATSANAVRALARRTHRRDLPLFVVGPHSEAVAHSKGFTTIHSGRGGVTALLPLLESQLRPADTVLFHAAPAQSTGTLEEELTARGFSLRSEILYEARAASALPHAAHEALMAGTADGVLLYSPRSARIFARLVEEAALAPNCRHLIAYCISPAAAAGLGGLPFAARRSAAHSDESGMMALLAP